MKKILLLALVACSSKKTEAPPAPVKTMDLDTLVRACWTAQSQGDVKALGDCYGEKVTVESPGAGFEPVTDKTKVLAAQSGMKHEFPDLELKVQQVFIDGDHGVAIVRLSGKARSGTPIGVLGAAAYEFAGGKISHEQDFFDSHTIKTQLEGKPGARGWAQDAAIPPSADPADPKGVELIKDFDAKFSAHDTKALGDLLADNVIWSDQSEAEDWNKTQFITDRNNGIGAFPDIKISSGKIWASGAYVIEQGAIEGTNNGSLPGLNPTHKPISVPFIAVYQLRDHKILHAWVFEQGAAITQQLGLK
ncbi:MAG: nuclear transport factor 2 family protein [Kofleriaceae bacterium]